MSGSGAGGFDAAQVSVGTTATLIAARRAGRHRITLVNHGTTPVYVGHDGSVTTTTGALLAGVAGQTLDIDTQGAVYGIVGTGTETVSAIETY